MELWALFNFLMPNFLGSSNDFEIKYHKKMAQNIKKLNVNTATYQELVAHPYIDAYLTKLIIHYRERNGPIRDLDELQRITHAYPELIEKLRPYIVF